MRYQVRFKSFKGKDCVVNIYTSMSDTDVTQLTPSDTPFSMEETNDNDLMTRLRYQTGYLQVIENSWNELIDIDNDYRVDMTYDGILYFHGWVNYSNISADISSFPHVKKIPIISSLGRLKDTAYPIAQLGSGISTIQMLSVISRLLTDGGWHSWIANGSFSGTLNVAFLEYLNPDFNINVNSFTGPYWMTKTYGEILEAYCDLYDWVLHDTASILIFQQISNDGEYNYLSSSGPYHSNIFGNAVRTFANDFEICGSRIRYDKIEGTSHVIERYDPQYGGASIDKSLLKVPTGAYVTTFLGDDALLLEPIPNQRGSIVRYPYTNSLGATYTACNIYAVGSINDFKFQIVKTSADGWYPFYSIFGWKPLVSFTVLEGAYRGATNPSVYFHVELSDDDKTAIHGGATRSINYTVQMSGNYFDANGVLQSATPIYHSCTFNEDGDAQGIDLVNISGRLSHEITITIYNNEIESWSQHMILRDISIKAYQYQDSELYQATMNNKADINTLYGNGEDVEIDNVLNVANSGNNRLYLGWYDDNPVNDFYYLSRDRDSYSLPVRALSPIHTWFQASSGLTALEIALATIYAGLYTFYDSKNYRTFALSFYPRDDEFKVYLQEYIQRPSNE